MRTAHVQWLSIKQYTPNIPNPFVYMYVQV